MRLEYFLILFIPTGLIGCASKIVPPTTYSFDVYQYKLNNNEFNKLKKEIRITTANPAIVVLNNENFWNTVEHLEQESFFSLYKYSNLECKIVDKESLSASNTKDQCVYSYTNPKLSIDLVANSYINNQISYTLNIANTSESKVTYKVNYNADTNYFLFTYKHDIDNLLFIIYKNELNIPWDSYKNSPQQYKSF